MVCEPEYMNMGPLNCRSSAVPVNGTQIPILLHFSHFFRSSVFINIVDLGEMIGQFCKIAAPTFKHRAVSSRATHSVSLHLTNVFKCLRIPSQGFM